MEIISKKNKKLANEFLSLKNILAPFGIQMLSIDSSYLFLGHLLDTLILRYQYSQPIHCFHILELAYEIGYEPAGKCLQYFYNEIDKFT